MEASTWQLKEPEKGKKRAINFALSDDYELYNIIKELHRVNNDFNVPIYLIGDYNNKNEKEGLIIRAFHKLAKDQLRIVNANESVPTKLDNQEM